MSTSQRGAGEGSGLEPGTDGRCRAVGICCTAWKLADTRSGRGVGGDSRRERKKGREGGRTGMMTGPKPREAACASLVTSGSVLGLPTRPKAHQCLVCVSGTSSGPPPLLLLGRSEASRQLVPHMAGYMARRQPLPPAPVAAEKKKKTPLCGNNRAPTARERKSQNNDLPSPTS